DPEMREGVEPGGPATRKPCRQHGSQAKQRQKRELERRSQGCADKIHGACLSGQMRLIDDRKVYNAGTRRTIASMRNGYQICFCLLMTAVLLGAFPVVVSAEGRIAERIETYPINGRTGMELYLSIGERGPKLGNTRAIAHTTFDLK